MESLDGELAPAKARLLPTAVRVAKAHLSVGATTNWLPRIAMMAEAGSVRSDPVQTKKLLMGMIVGGDVQSTSALQVASHLMAGFEAEMELKGHFATLEAVRSAGIGS